MNKFTDFITKYNSRYVEVVDPNAYAQCFDLVLQWCIELGIPKNIFPFANAYQIYTNYGPNQSVYFDRIYNSPDAIPKEGDILVWGNSYNYAGGHTGIYKSGDIWTFTAFIQNDPFKTPSHLKTYNYNYVLGWLRYKNYISQPTVEQLVKSIKDKINTNISDTEFRQWTRKLLNV